MIARKCKNGEMKNIIKVADAAFKQDRPKGFSFKSEVSQIYNNTNVDYSSSHFVVEDENKKFVAIVGNLISDICVHNTAFTFSRVGSVGTIPEFRGQGLMKKLMALVEKENQDQNVVFSVLSGKRNRYKNYGYERINLSTLFVFDKDQERYLKNIYNVYIKPYCEKDLFKIYKIYKDSEKFALRDKQNFEICLNNKIRKLFKIFIKDKIVGYVSIKDCEISEICLTDVKFLESVMAFLVSSKLINFKINDYNDKFITVPINILNKKLYQEFEKIADTKTLLEEKSFKVYNLKRFIEMLYLLNDKSFNKDISETYKVDDEILSFKIKDNNLEICQTKQKYQKEFKTKEEFLKFALGGSLSYTDSKIFPLYFDLNMVDNF